MEIEEIQTIMGRPPDDGFYMTMRMTYWWFGDDGIVSIETAGSGLYRKRWTSHDPFVKPLFTKYR